MRAHQNIVVEIWDEHICAAFNEPTIEIFSELECKAVDDWEGAHGFYRDFTSFEDEDILYPIEINGVSFSKEDLNAKLNDSQVTQLEEQILSQVDVDSWKVEEPEYD